MNAKDAILHELRSSENLVAMFLKDLSDADLLVRPVPNANHIAWQLGHLILADAHMQQTLGGKPYELPAGFAAQHDKATASIDPPQGFAAKEAYFDLLHKVRARTIDTVANMTDADIDKPNDGPMAAMAPTKGKLALLAATHWVMHLGQFTVVRRKLGKPVLF